MISRTTALCAGLLLLLAAPLSVSAERCPCGDLVLPYFEVEIPGPGKAGWAEMATTAFSVGNCSADPLEVRIGVWSNWGLEVLSTDVTIDPKAIFPVNLRDWLVFGQLPNHQLSAEELAHVQAALCGEPSPKDGLYYSSPTHPLEAVPAAASRAEPVPPQVAVGYVTAQVLPGLGSHGDLWGDYFVIRPRDEFARGESLVRIVADATREVCENHLIRFLEGGAFDAGTRFVFWTGRGGSAPSAEPVPPFELETAHCIVYDEQGNLLGEDDIPLMATQALEVGDLGWIEPFGWVQCETEGLSFVCVDFSAENTYGVTLRSFCEPEQVGPPPRLRLQKATNGLDADQPPGLMVIAETEVEWTYTVTNIGPVPLTGITVSDNQGVEVDCPSTELAPNESMTCTGSGVCPAGQYRNVGVAVGREPGGRQVVASDLSHCFGMRPAIDLIKLVDGVDANEPPGAAIPESADVVWTYEVRNIGDVPLSGIALTDDPEGLMGGEPYFNLGTVVGTAPDGTQVEAEDPAYCYPDLVVDIDLIKFVNGEDANQPPGVLILEGTPVTWTYEICNVGNVPLTGIVLTDEPEGLISCPASELPVGGSMTCTHTGVMGSEPYFNLGTVVGTAPDGTDVFDEDPAYCHPDEPVGDEGCTPGYWKNHPGSWDETGYSADQSCASVYPGSAAYDIGSATLMEALDFGGGSSLKDAAGILMRAAVAAALNVAHPDVAYPHTWGEVSGWVDAALASGDRDTILGTAALLDASNNAGCPLN